MKTLSEKIDKIQNYLYEMYPSKEHDAIDETLGNVEKDLKEALKGFREDIRNINIREMIRMASSSDKHKEGDSKLAGIKSRIGKLLKKHFGKELLEDGKE